MSNQDDTKAAQVQQQQQGDAQPPAEAQKPETKEHYIPKSRLDEEIAKRKELEQRLKTLEDAYRKAEEKSLREKEDYKTLYEKTAEELAAINAKAKALEAYESTIRDVLAAAIEEIPQDRRSLIPEELSPDAQLRWIQRNRAFLSKAEPIDIGAGRRGGESPKIELSQEELAIAQRMGLKPDEYQKYKR